MFGGEKKKALSLSRKFVIKELFGFWTIPGKVGALDEIIKGNRQECKKRKMSGFLN